MPKDAWTVALRLLSARGRTRLQLDRLLEGRGFGAEDRERTLARLAELGYLDDRALAQARAASLLGRGRLAPDAVRRRLEGLGVLPATAERAVAQAVEEQGFQPAEAARRLLERRHLFPARGLQERAKAQRLLASRGFDEDLIARLLGVPGLDNPGSEE